MSLYREEILDHYKNPRNFGWLDKADIKVKEANASCGDLIELYLKIKKDKSFQIGEVKFKGEGCAISLAAASMLTESIKGRELKELEKLENRDVYKLLGGKVNPGRIRCATLALTALKKGLIIYFKEGKWQRKS